MQIFTNVDSTAFTLNGTRYVKNFIVMKVGSTNIQVLNAYDSSVQILSSTHYSEVQVDGNIYGSQALLMNALANVCFSKSAGSGSAVVQNNVGLFNTTLQYTFSTPSNTLLPSEIVTRLNLTYAFAVSEIQTPYFFQFVRPALQEGSSTPIQKKYVFMFTGGKGIYGLNQTPVASTQFKLIVESVLNPSDIVDDDTAVINYLGDLANGDYINAANESEWDFFDTDKTYYFSYTTGGVLYYVVFVGEPGLYGSGNQSFVQSDLVDTTNSDALPYIPTLQEVITAGSSATTANDIVLTTTGGKKLKYNNSEVLTDTNSQSKFNAKADLVEGKVPASQLPAYVDDVLEFATVSAFPSTGESGKIYVATTTNLTYRWGGSGYVEISPSIALGETSSTAYRGDRGKIAYDHSQASGNPHNTSKSDIGLGNVDNTSDLNKPISVATQTGLNLKANLNGGNSFTGTQNISSNNNSEKGLVIKPFSFSQSANLFELQNAAGTALNYITAGGDFYNLGAVYTPTIGNNVTARGTMTFPSSGMTISRAISDAIPTLVVSNNDQSSSANIIDYRSNLSSVVATRAYVGKTGLVGTFDSFVARKSGTTAQWYLSTGTDGRFSISNLYSSSLPTMLFGETNYNVSIPNGKLSVASAPTEINDVVRKMELDLKANIANTYTFIGNIGASIDLNTYNTTGLYMQRSNANAASGTNYPVAVAGKLEVFATIDYVFQTYHSYATSNVFYFRTQYQGVWSTWKQSSSSADMEEALALKANINSPVFNNSVVLPNNITISGGSALNLLRGDGQVQSIQGTVRGTSIGGDGGVATTINVNDGFQNAIWKLQNQSNLKALDADVVHKSGNLTESINGAKTFLNPITYSASNFDVLIDNAVGVSIIDKITTPSGWSRMFRVSDNAGATLGGVGVYGNGQTGIYGYLSMNAYNHQAAILKFTTTGVGIGITGTSLPTAALDVVGDGKYTGNVGIGANPPSTWKLQLQGQFGISALNTSGQSVWELYNNAKEIRHNYGFKLVGYSGLATGQTWFINGVDGSANFTGKVTTIPATNANEVVIKSQLDSGLSTAANNVASSYLSKSGDTTKSGVMTFNDSPIIPDGVQPNHPITKKQRDLDYQYFQTEINKRIEKTIQIEASIPVGIGGNTSAFVTIPCAGAKIGDFVEYTFPPELLVGNISMLQFVPMVTDNDFILLKITNYLATSFSTVMATFKFRINR